MSWELDGTPNHFGDSAIIDGGSTKLRTTFFD